MYLYLYNNLIMPLYEKVFKRRKILAYKRQLEKSQWWPREKLLDYQCRELKKLIDHAYTQTSYWKKTFASLDITPNDIRELKDLR